MTSGGRAGPLEAAQHGLDAGDELARGEGLGDVVVGAELEAVDAVVLGGARGEEDDGDDAEGGVLAEAPAEVEAVAAGHHDVEQEEGGRLAFGVGDDAADGEVGADGEAGALQVILHQARDVGVIFQHKDGLTQRSDLRVVLVDLAMPDACEL